MNPLFPRSLETPRPRDEDSRTEKTLLIGNRVRWSFRWRRHYAALHFSNVPLAKSTSHANAALASLDTPILFSLTVGPQECQPRYVQIPFDRTKGRLRVSVSTVSRILLAVLTYSPFR